MTRKSRTRTKKSVSKLPEQDIPVRDAKSLSEFTDMLFKTGCSCSESYYAGEILRAVRLDIPSAFSYIHEKPPQRIIGTMRTITLTACGYEGVIYRYSLVEKGSAQVVDYLTDYLELRGITVTRGMWDEASVRAALFIRKDLL